MIGRRVSVPRRSIDGLIESSTKQLVLRIHYGVGPIGRDHTAAQLAFADAAVVFEAVDRRFGRGQYFDVESLEERARAKCRGLQGRANLIEVAVGSRLFENYIDAEDFSEDVIEPQPGRRALKQMETTGKQPPRFPRIGIRWTTPRRHT